MTVNQYAIIDGKTKKIKNKYTIIDGKTRKIKKEYVVINGKTRLCWSGFDPNFVACVSNNKVMSSYGSDITRWTSVSEIRENSGYVGKGNLASGNGLYIISYSVNYGGLYDKIFYSYDGQIWTCVELPGTDSTSTKSWNVFFCNGNFYAMTGYFVSQYGTGAYFKSSDGKNWVKINGLYNGYTPTAMVYAKIKDTYYYIQLCNNKFYYSSDAESWTQYTPLETSSYTIECLFECNGYAYYVGRLSDYSIYVECLGGSTNRYIDTSKGSFRGFTVNNDKKEIAIFLSDGGMTTYAFTSTADSTPYFSMCTPYVPHGYQYYQRSYGAGKYVSVETSNGYEYSEYAYTYNLSNAWTQGNMTNGLRYNDHRIDALCYGKE